MNALDICFLLFGVSSCFAIYVTINESRNGNYWNVTLSLILNLVIWLTYLAMLTLMDRVTLESLSRAFNLTYIVSRIVGGDHCYFFYLPESSTEQSDAAYSSLDNTEMNDSESSTSSGGERFNGVVRNRRRRRRIQPPSSTEEESNTED